jgi:hypothetical protein
MPPKKKAKAEPVSTPVASPQPKYVWMVQHNIKVVIEKFGKDMTDGHSGYTFSEHDDEEDEEMIEERRAHEDSERENLEVSEIDILEPPAYSKSANAMKAARKKFIELGAIYWECEEEYADFTPEQWAEQFYDDKPLNNDGHFIAFDFSSNFLKISKDSELYNNGQHLLDVNITVGIRQVPVV